MVQVCHSYILLYLWWCLHNMWDRFLIKCDWLFTLESKKQIFLWYVYKVQNHLVQCITPPPPSKLLWRKEMCDLFCASLYFKEGQVQGLGWFLTWFPLKFAENNHVGEIVIWGLYLRSPCLSRCTKNRHFLSYRKHRHDTENHVHICALRHCQMASSHRVTDLEKIPVRISKDEAPTPLSVVGPLFISSLLFHLSQTLLNAWRFSLFHSVYSSFHKG